MRLPTRQYRLDLGHRGSTSFGLQGTWTASDASPASFTLNGTTCGLATREGWEPLSRTLGPAVPS